MIAANGGAAFPRPISNDRDDGGVICDESPAQDGMTLLAYYAGQALVGHGPIQPGEHYPTIADSCVRAARALVIRLYGDGEADDLDRDYNGNLVWRRDMKKGDVVRISPEHLSELKEVTE